ncbi:hypothetical protein BGZ75_004919 [Mortierella antarctica]|nr:hypothetical protein BGZ75_004919 [Mortierella antarctica]
MDLDQQSTKSTKSLITAVETDPSFQEERQEERQDLGGHQQEDGPISPETRANFLEGFSLWWLNDLFRIGSTRQIQEQDLYRLPDRRRAQVVSQNLYDHWEEEKLRAVFKGRTPSLLRALRRSFWRMYLPSYIYLEMGDACQIWSPIVMQMLLKFLQNTQSEPATPPPVSRGYGLAAGIFALSFVQIMLYTHWNLNSVLTGLSIRTALVDLVFRKATTLSAKAHLLYSDGSIINMMSTDISRIESAMMPVISIFASPVFVLVIVALLVRLMGPSALLGALILFLFSPLQGWGMSTLGPVRKKASQFTDSRIRLSTEILQGVRVIKFFAWENSFLKKLAEIRVQELSFVGRILRTRGFITATSSASAIPVLASTLSFALYSALGNELNPEVVFPALAYYSIMRVSLLVLPSCYSSVVDAYVAVGRLQKFLLSDDDNEIAVIVDESAKDAILIEDADFVWDALPPSVASTLSSSDTDSSSSSLLAKKDGASANEIDQQLPVDQGSQGVETAPFLRNINLKIPRGSLVAVVGPVGSGKSSLLQAIVGNMKKCRGQVVRGTTISYAPQTPWIQNTSVRDNILFGTAFDQDRYWRIVKACCLEEDLESLPAGDLTEIGERGINLSGGQKTRLSLARSIYFDAGTVIMDDPLSAVDAQVGKQLWEDCILGELKDRTRVIATHQLHVLPYVDYVIVLKDGAIVEEGPFNDLMDKGGNFTELMIKYGGVVRVRADDNTDLNISRASSSNTVQQQSSSTDSKRGEQESLAENGGGQDGRNSQGTGTNKAAAKESSTPAGGSKLIMEEERESGAVSTSVYAEYFRMAGIWTWIAVLATYILGQACNLMMNYWLSLWSGGAIGLSTTTNILVYVSFAITQFVFAAIASQLLSYAVIKTAREMHRKAFDKTIHARLSFFDTNPLGRILNRFSKDVDTIDNVLWGTLNDIFVTGLIVLGSVTMAIAYFPWLLIAVVPMAGLYYYLSIYYRRTSREVKRLDSTLRSVLYAYFSESLSGMGTLKAYNRVEYAVRVNQQKLDFSNRPYYLFQIGTRWISLRVNLLGIIFTFMTAMFIVQARHTISAAAAGLVLSYLVRTGGDMNWVVQCVSMLENNMNSTERLVHYVKNLPQEPLMESLPGKKPASDWPSQGAISFKNVTMRYRLELPPVLNNISFDIQPGHKIGVVGRTGAGKSSLIQALFLLCDLDAGQVVIDGIDTQTISTADLRSNIAIIPQEPVLFHGTFRYNLDPLGKHAEQELWRVLETSDLKAYVQAQDGGLDAMVSDRGENLSVGQRQLVCLSRALLAKSKIVVLDEATANVDMATDALIQKAIRVNFADATVVTVAHRINTIVDYDRILVMSQGQVAEYDSPRQLLSDPFSAFSSLVSETGAQNAAHLRSLTGL